ncbi:hypothetical protein BB559_004420 [Furculomyces boomerangus]|uniref:Protein kinase domain-containing protein n=2 Tax=Harpellales TaxID=61421 RepID=A0A2T9YEQ4_9FUNG|nr:hypothetical protein BB559_004420 [Furculomyces boomerangus]PWA00547.1 hypothetical protein BB558_003401 [Smittium angustum]
MDVFGSSLETSSPSKNIQDSLSSKDPSLSQQLNEPPGDILVEIKIENGLQNEVVDENGLVKGSTHIQKKVNLDNFDVIKLIGIGGYGKVYLVQKKDTKRYFAMKVMKKASIMLYEKQVNFTKTERNILELVQHPFIVKLYYAFQSNSRLYLIMDYISGGELFFHMAKERIFIENHAVFYAAEIVVALGHLHKLGIIYRDLKPENILLNSDGHLVLTDFGLSKQSSRSRDKTHSRSNSNTSNDSNDEEKTNTFCGTPSYMAPEIFDLKKPYEKSVDWWSLGILIFEMLTGKVPFNGKSHKQVYESIIKKKIAFPKYVSSDAADLIRKLLKKVPEQRIGYGANELEKIMKHRFFYGVNWNLLATNHKLVTPPIVPKISFDGDSSNFDPSFTSQAISLQSQKSLNNLKDYASDISDNPPHNEYLNMNSNYPGLAHGIDALNLGVTPNDLCPQNTTPVPISIPKNIKPKPEAYAIPNKNTNKAGLHNQPIQNLHNQKESTKGIPFDNDSSPEDTTFHGFSFVAHSLLHKQDEFR